MRRIRHFEIWIALSPRALHRIFVLANLNSMRYKQCINRSHCLQGCNYLVRPSFPKLSTTRSIREIVSCRAVSIQGLAPGSVFDYQQSSTLAESTVGCQSQLRLSIFKFSPFSASLSAQPAPALFELLGHAVCPNSSKSFMFHPETDNSGK